MRAGTGMGVALNGHGRFLGRRRVDRTGRHAVCV
jgi:hypothetical protein